MQIGSLPLELVTSTGGRAEKACGSHSTTCSECSITDRNDSVPGDASITKFREKCLWPNFRRNQFPHRIDIISSAVGLSVRSKVVLPNRRLGRRRNPWKLSETEEKSHLVLIGTRNKCHPPLSVSNGSQLRSDFYSCLTYIAT